MFSKIIAFIKKFVFDMFTDIRNNFDEKRFWGNVLMLAGITYPFVFPASSFVWAVAGGFIGFATLCLGIAARADSKIGDIPPIFDKVIDKLNGSKE